MIKKIVFLITTCLSSGICDKFYVCFLLQSDNACIDVSVFRHGTSHWRANIGRVANDVPISVYNYTIAVDRRTKFDASSHMVGVIEQYHIQTHETAYQQGK